jgi:vacuolar-type H+-ATPase subunit I/STV1
MADKNFLSWVGFKGDQSPQTPSQPQKVGTPNVADRSHATEKPNAIERIRELESQLNDLRSRRDITALSQEEFEILATETAMSIIKTAQQREARANATAEKILSESQRAARSTLESAEIKAKSALSQAESRGRQYIKAAEADAADMISRAETEAEEILTTKRREANLLTSQAKKEAELLVTSATTEVAEYRTWLQGVMAEAERLYRIQTQSLDAAENAISQSRDRLNSAFNRLADMQQKVLSAITGDGKPRTSPSNVTSLAEKLESKKISEKKVAKRASTQKRAAKKRR